jgi:MFS superfamily sulfate permease-like transporter
VTRFDIGVVVVTFVALALAALFRGIIVPIVRARVAANRQSSDPTLTGAELRAEIRRLTQRNLELEQRISLVGQAAGAADEDPVPLTGDRR